MTRALIITIQGKQYRPALHFWTVKGLNNFIAALNATVICLTVRKRESDPSLFCTSHVVCIRLELQYLAALNMTVILRLTVKTRQSHLGISFTSFGVW